MLSANAIALERLLVQRRAHPGALLYGAAFDRWGPNEGPDYDRVMAEVEEARAGHRRITDELVALTADIAVRDREAMVAWTRAHIDLLERFIAANSANEQMSTARYVAKEQIGLWHNVQVGELNYVDENSYYVHLDPAAYAEYFGDLK